ncbi:helix-turn-helix domain-containing protein [Paraburkholderia sp.]|jgi:DNA-binding XRE family transcriptional regulator|uniref:helix-turn-helix domain-containing protein n=1 Tax=Paraburkholderia sp. TaxID=1926495 RepID=UPI003C7AD8CA
MDCTLQIFLDDRWVDFAPMYLDPELIPRVLRWYRPDTRVDLTDWADVLAALPVPDRERRMLALALSRFAAQIERLPDIMEAQGVDHDIIEFLAQTEFAAHRGVSRRVIQDIERGTGNPTVDSLNSVAKLFGLQAGFVTIRRNEPASPTSG